MNKIYVLCGLPGSGKSYLLKKLRELKNKEFNNILCLDIDECLLDFEGAEFSSVADLIIQKGEENFRKIENETMRRVVSCRSVCDFCKLFKVNKSEEKYIFLALGGGSLDLRLTDSLLNNKLFHLIYLNETDETCKKRILFDINKRPTFSGLKDEKHEAFYSKLFNERKKLYNKALSKIKYDGKYIYLGNETHLKDIFSALNFLL